MLGRRVSARTRNAGRASRESSRDGQSGTRPETPQRFLSDYFRTWRCTASRPAPLPRLPNCPRIFLGVSLFPCFSVHLACQEGRRDGVKRAEAPLPGAPGACHASWPEGLPSAEQAISRLASMRSTFPSSLRLGRLSWPYLQLRHWRKSGSQSGCSSAPRLMRGRPTGIHERTTGRLTSRCEPWRQKGTRIYAAEQRYAGRETETG